MEVAEKAFRNMAILSMNGFPPLCHRTVCGKTGCLYGEIYKKRLVLSISLFLG
jgi:hypothetical protein